jgi:hypothetical protein
VALGPPGEYGEITIRVPIDPGQPFVLPAWNRFKKTLTAETDVETGASWHHGIQA